MELGEAITIPEFLRDEVHSKNTCPWHASTPGQAKKMEATDPDEDVPNAMPPNDGGKLGKNMKNGKDSPPKADTVSIYYEKGAVLKYKAGKKTKTVQSYSESEEEEIYGLQYAPHHLIPGNESLKGSSVVQYLGDDPTIAEFADDKSSLIKDGFSVDYDVNRSVNGVWLPSPYALSNSNAWPAEPGIEVIKKRRGIDLAKETEAFKAAYVAASIAASGGRQFHMRHNKYSDKVAEILEAIASRLKLMVAGECPIAADNEDDGKFDPPMGLPGRLNVLSGNLRRLLIGGVWRDPMFTDELTREYSEDLKSVRKKGRLFRVV